MRSKRVLASPGNVFYGCVGHISGDRAYLLWDGVCAGAGDSYWVTGHSSRVIVAEARSFSYPDAKAGWGFSLQLLLLCGNMMFLLSGTRRYFLVQRENIVIAEKFGLKVVMNDEVF
ncbi:hypothetical protein AVEN_62261-1 [Araneus ventricosus]|uniref:Uncharacterized protein n=1 Tax=Araneus ventricosus TaxID=182803 RepID=A0A4Y2EB32_ARAVE|nr:hypothetical protein AVEN_62261-1 [Araneus ventricosus]